MSPSEKISLLESLLARVQERAQTRPPRTVQTAQTAQPLQAESTAATHPPASAAVEVSSPAPAVAPVAEPTPVVNSSVNLQPKVEATPSIISVPTPPRTTSSASLSAIRAGTTATPSDGAYVTRGGVSDELPELELGDEGDESDEELGYAETVMVDDEPLPSSAQQEALEAQEPAEELGIPQRPSHSLLNATVAALPLSMESTGSDEFEVDHRPLASAVPPSPEVPVVAAIPPASASRPHVETYTTDSEYREYSESGGLEVSATSIAPPSDDEPELEHGEENDTPAATASAATSETEVSATTVAEQDDGPLIIDPMDDDGPSVTETAAADSTAEISAPAASSAIETAPTLMAAIASVIPPATATPEPEVSLESNAAPTISMEPLSAPTPSPVALDAAIQQELRAEVHQPQPLADAAIVEEQTVLAPQAPLTFMAMLRRSLTATIR